MAGFHTDIAGDLRECSFRHTPEDELNLPEEIRARLEALGNLK